MIYCYEKLIQRYQYMLKINYHIFNIKYDN